MTTYHKDRMMTDTRHDVPLSPEHQQTQLQGEAILATLAAMYAELQDIRTALLPPMSTHHPPRHQSACSVTQRAVPIRPDILRHERECRGWSQTKVAEAIGSDPATVSRWERGISKPYPHFREKLGALFGISVEELGLLPTHTVSCSDPLQIIPPCSANTCDDCGWEICSKCGFCHYCNDIDLPC